MSLILSFPIICSSTLSLFLTFCKKTYVRFLFTASSSHSHLFWKIFPLVFPVPWRCDKHADEASGRASVSQTGGVNACVRIVAVKRGAFSREGARQATKVLQSRNQDSGTCRGVFLTDKLYVPPLPPTSPPYVYILPLEATEEHYLAGQLLQICEQHTNLQTCAHRSRCGRGTVVCWGSLSGDKSDRLICPARGWRVIGHI